MKFTPALFAILTISVTALEPALLKPASETPPELNTTHPIKRDWPNFIEHIRGTSPTRSTPSTHQPPTLVTTTAPPANTSSEKDVDEF